MRHAPIHAAPPVGGALSEAELPGASNPSEPFAAASQAVRLYNVTGQPTPVGNPDGRLSVNPVTGDMSLSLGDLYVPERGVPLGLSLTYNSYLASTDGPFGHGWSFNAGMSLTRAADGSVTISQENGSQVTFQHNSVRYVAPPRVIASLRLATGGFVFTRGTLGKNCPSYSRSCVKFFFSEPVGFAPGRLTKITSPDGGLTFTYNKLQAGQIVSVKDPGNRTLAIKYRNGRVIATALDANGGFGVQTAYDANGNLTRFTNAGGGRYGFLYGTNHLLSGIVDPRGVETDVLYDPAGRVQSITGPAGETDFSRSPGQTSISPPGGPVSTAYYADGEVTRIDEGDTSPPLATTLIRYDPATLGVIAVTDPDGHTSRMAYDTLGHLTSFTDPLGQTSSYHFGAASGIITATDPLGNVSQAITDTGRVVSIRVDSSDPALTQITRFTYTAPANPGDVTAMTDAGGGVYRFTYDKFGDPTSFSDPLGDTSSAGYDRMGRPVFNTLPTGNVPGANPDAFSSTNTYDPEGRLLSATDPLGKTESFAYDPAGNLVATVVGGHQTSYGYDAAGRWTVVTRPNGSQSTLSDLSNGHVGEVCDDGNNCEEYTYDALGRPASVTDALGNTSSFVYSPGGLLLSSTDANGVTTSYTHDADGRTTGISYSDGITHPVTFDFDADGRMLAMTDASGTSSFTYDSLGRKTREVSGLGMESDLVYDRLNHVTSMTLNSVPMASYTYDAAGRMASVTDRLGNATTFSYDASSNLTQTLFPAGVVDSNGYDAAGRTVNFTIAQGSVNAVIPNNSLHRNLLGQITGATQTGLGQPDQTYTYDVNGRVASVNSNPVKLDSRDNLLQNAAGDTFTYDAADRLVSEDQKSVTPDINWTFGYDANGSRASASTLDGTQSKSFVWDAAGNLASFTDGSTSESNTYDGLGRKVSSTAGGATHLAVWGSTHMGSRATDPPDEDCGGTVDAVWYFGGGGSGGGICGAVAATHAHSGEIELQRLLVATTPGVWRLLIGTTGGIFRGAIPSGPLAADGTVYLYGPDGLPVEQLDSSDTALFYHHDQLGSTRAVTNATGHVVAVMAYDTYGNQTYHSGTVTVPFGFGGGYTDPVSRLILFGGNYYDPPTGQFLRVAPPTANPGDPQTVHGNARRGGVTDAGPDVGLFFDTYEKRVGPIFVPDRPGDYRCSLATTPTLVPDRPGDYQFRVVVSNIRATPCGAQAVTIDAAARMPLGTSPYSAGGGDPINSAMREDKGRLLVGGN